MSDVILGETCTITASRHSDLYTSASGRFIIAHFTSPINPKLIPASVPAYGKTQMFVVKGVVPEGEKGTKYELTGYWQRDAKNQNKLVFEVTKAILAIPKTQSDVVKFLTSTVRGVGATRAKKIYAALGDKAVYDLANPTEDTMQKVAFLGEETVARLQLSCKKALFQYELMELIGGLDVPTDSVGRIVEVYGDKSLDVVRSNPYWLVSILGFRVADAIAIALGEMKNSNRRVLAGVLEAHRETSVRTGSVCVDAEMLTQNARKLLGMDDVTEQACQDAITFLREKKRLVRQGQYVLDVEDYKCEKSLAGHIAQLAAMPPRKTQEIEQALTEWQKKNTITLSKRQVDAVKSLAYPLSVVTGGPGTGKSTTLRAIMDVYKMVFPNAPVLLMAPTGLAAKRMTDSTGIQAATIHSACGLIPSRKRSGFSAQSDTTIPAGFVALDEMSMVGIYLANFVFDAVEVRSETRIVLLGDVDQLPPISPGNVLDDLIRSKAVRVTVLDRNYRQGEKSSIADAAYAINRGEQNKIPCDEEFRFLEKENDDVEKESEEIIQAMVQCYEQAISDYGIENAIILSPTHLKGPLCTNVLNKIIQERVNPSVPGKASCKIRSLIFRVGDRVIQTRNTKMAINGDLGCIVSIDTLDGELTVTIRFDSGKTHVYGRKEMNNVELAYAISVHKAQGCEFSCCIMPASMTQQPMLVRRLYYTAVTRAKKRMIVIGNKRAFSLAIRTNHSANRKSLLGPRIIKLQAAING